jgi:hypothetical protein
MIAMENVTVTFRDGIDMGKGKEIGRERKQTKYFDWSRIWRREGNIYSGRDRQVCALDVDSCVFCVNLFSNGKQISGGNQLV